MNIRLITLARAFEIMRGRECRVWSEQGVAVVVAEDSARDALCRHWSVSREGGIEAPFVFWGYGYFYLGRKPESVKRWRSDYCYARIICAT